MATPVAKDRQLIYVWEAPVRVAHWLTVVCMFVLAISGYYIGDPFIVTSTQDGAAHYIMGEMRFIHAVSAAVLGLSFITRLYWATVGNRYARFSGMLPLTKRRRRDFIQMTAYYMFLSMRRPEYFGHNPIAGLSYFAIFALVLLEGLTGLALYAEYFPGSFWWISFGWVRNLGLRSAELRLVHHGLMWLFVVFFLIHLYLAVFNDLVERSGVNSSIVTGFKQPPTEHDD